MKYPKRLIPCICYKYIIPQRIYNLSENFYFIRHTKSKNFIDRETNKIKINEICHPRENILNYSINLAGIYKEEDVLFELLKDYNKTDQFHSQWEECERGIIPDKYFINKNRGKFYLKLNEVFNTILPDPANSLNIGFEINCTVHHKPTKVNFWHFELNWESLENQGLNIQQSNNWRKKKLSSTARAFILEIGIPEIPQNIFNIPKKEYKKNLLQIISCFFKNPLLLFRF